LQVLLGRGRSRHARACPAGAAFCAPVRGHRQGRAAGRDFTARERLAAFLVNLSRRCQARGICATRLRLPMPWTDVATYLRLAPESVSRLVKGLEEEGLLDVARREVVLADLHALQVLAGNILRAPEA
jgi:CRP/FNR family transcriptional regulator